MAYSIGARMALAGGQGRLWGPLLIACCGLGLLLAGIFHPDAELGFPPGAPPGLTPPSGQMIVHQSAFFIVVFSVIAACFVFSRAFRSRGQKGWSRYSIATGIVSPVLMVVGFGTETIIAVTAMAVITLGWLSAIAVRLRADLKEAA
jgi:FtsH-binding integral membrane protein